ncbi:MAG: LPS export ABC transporter permease LptG [Francisella sp.]
MLFNKIDRYIFKTVFSSFFIVIVIFCLVFFIFTYVAQVSENSDKLSNYEIIISTLIQIPGILYTLLPVCAMIGALMGLSLLAHNSEIIVLRSAGLSTFQIAKGVVLVGIIGAMVTVIFGGYVAPYLQLQIDTNIAKYNNNDLWLKTSDGFINIDYIDPNKRKAFGVKKIILKNNKLQEFRHASLANYNDDYSADAFNVKKVTFPDNNNKHIDISKNISKTEWADPIPISIVKVITISDSDYLNFTQLVKYMLSDTKSQELLSLKFWQEVFQPLSLLILILIPVPLSLGSARSSSLIIKLLLGALFGFTFFIINQIFGPITLILHLPTIVGAAGPTIVALILLIFLFIKSKEK